VNRRAKPDDFLSNVNEAQDQHARVSQILTTLLNYFTLQHVGACSPASKASTWASTPTTRVD